MKTMRFALVIFASLVASAGAIEEVGNNDFRLSDMGPDGDAAFGAFQPAVAYNSRDHEYLVVWRGEDNRNGQIDGETEIFVQRIDADTRRAIGANDRRVSAFGGLGDSSDRVDRPKVAYNPHAHEYLVVWEGHLDGNGSGIFGQRLDASTGAPIGADDFLISDGSRALFPGVAYNPMQREYLVVWMSDGVAPLASTEFEIFIRRVDGATGDPLGATHQRISEMFGLGEPLGSARSPAVAVDPVHNRYLVVWSGVDTNVGKAEIHGQLIDGVTGAEVGIDDARVSHTGFDSEGDQFAAHPAVAFDPSAGDDGEFLVAFQTDLVTGGIDREIYAQRIDPVVGLRLDIFDRAISSRSHSGGVAHESQFVAVAARPTGGFLVTWSGEHATLGDGEHEIFGRLVGQTLNLQSAALRLSDMGGTGTSTTLGSFPDVVAGRTGEYLVVWHGKDDVARLVESEFEIFGQCLSTRLFSDGFESGDLSAWTVVQ